jgi:hypothetical protein
MTSYSPEFQTLVSYPKFNADPISLYPRGEIPAGLEIVDSDTVNAPPFVVAGALTGLAITTAGSGLPDGDLVDVALSGGTGQFATADITIASGAVTVAAVNFGGRNYTGGDELTVSALPGVVLTASV